jgi:hypothetical protein
MLHFSQPLDSKYSEILMKNSEEEETNFSEDKIKSQTIGNMFDDFSDECKKRKPSLGLRFYWLWRDIKDAFYNTKYAIRNHFKWRKTIRQIRPWEGFDGLLTVMLTHLMDYIETEEKYGHSEEQYKKNKIATAKETVELLERMKNPDDYSDKHLEKIKSRYPKYKSLVTKYINGGSGFCGDFVAQGNGWTGKESGKDPQSGYFEFINGKFQITKSPDQNETDRLLAELENYHSDLTNAYKQAGIDSDNDFDRLGQLLKDNLYSWWD